MNKHTIRILILAAAGILPASLQAQVPAFINYQGRVADSSGVGLGTGTPTNRKVLFRLFDAPTAGTRLWTEEQTVTIANGEFSVLLGNGVTATGTAAGESRPALDGVFTSGTSSRYLELTVDTGDNVFNATDQPISPRQRITSTAYTFRAQSAESIAAGSSLQMGSNADSGLGFYGTGRLFGGINVNGPVLYGSSGGGLGSVAGTTQNLALTWDSLNKVTTTGDLTINGKAIAKNSLKLGPPANGEMGGDGMRFLLYPGTATQMPYGYGIENGAIYSLVSETTQAHRWYANSTRVMSLNEGGNGLLNVPGGFTTAGNVQAANLSTSGNGSITTSGTGNVVVGGKVIGNASHGVPTVGVSGSDGTKIALFPGTATSVPYGIGVEGGFLYGVVPSDAGYKWYAGTNVKMTLDTNGNLGLGTTSPARPLQIGSSSATEQFLRIQTAGGNATRCGLELRHFNGDSGWSIISDERVTAPNARGLHFVEHLGSTAGTTQMFISGGKVGIGTTAPVVPLHVKATAYNQANTKNGSDPDYGVHVGLDGAVAYQSGFDAASLGDNRNIKYSNIAAFFDGDIVTRIAWFGQTLSFSDRRAKHVLGLSDTAADLDKLLRLKITDYTWIDRSKDQRRPHKQLIAQEVEEIFPQAVSIHPAPQTIPSVYEMAVAVKHDAATGLLSITTQKPHGFKVDDIVDLYADKVELKGVKVQAVNGDNQFTVASGKPAEKVFVYGKQVSDFRSVDYDAIAMLNVSATQQIKKEKDAEVAALKAENEKLRLQLKDQAARLVALEAAEDVRDAKLAAKLAVIEKLLGGAEKPAARTVSLKKDSGAE